MFVYHTAYMEDLRLPFRVFLPMSEYIFFCEDLVRVSTIQFVLQFMLSLRGEATFNFGFLELVLYMLAGVAMYWLIVKKVLVFESKKKARPLE